MLLQHLEAYLMDDQDHDMFEDGDPWDYIVNMAATLEKLILAHNDLAEESIKMRKKITILTARVEELKAIAINEAHSVGNIQRPKQ